MVTVANNDGWNRGGLTREKYTIRVVHVGGGAGVHDPAGVLERHLVQGGDESILPVCHYERLTKPGGH